MITVTNTMRNKKTEETSGKTGALHSGDGTDRPAGAGGWQAGSWFCRHLPSYWVLLQ